MKCRNCGCEHNELGGFCSDRCREEYKRNHNGADGNLDISGCVMAPFLLVGWIFKHGWRATKWCGCICCKVFFNKYVLTFFTMGMSWATWKLLDKVYGKK